ncbi:prepilin-type N-terminal cleavage/methylation domain-containing protein [Thalassotalea euphylliae]|uniref:prepilin-type N-terminal cleavage/methylation domain-containing protein n=1 Tax=Thalassotalea euphylliae TaxID=1655234 RepID=UPI003633358B
MRATNLLYPLKKPKHRGFTLIELIIGIVVFAISLTMVVRFVVPASTQSASQLQQIKAAELGQSLLNEILGKSFDENSDRAGGVIRCGEENNSGVLVGCTDHNNLGSDTGEDRTTFDDVDDYIDFTFADSLDNSYANEYQGFNITINVFYDSNLNDVNDVDESLPIGNIKYVQIDVVTPASETITFAAYRTNF